MFSRSIVNVEVPILVHPVIILLEFSGTFLIDYGPNAI